MSTGWIDGSKTGDLAFVDSDGFRRYRGRTQNVYGSAEDALAAGERTLRRGSEIFVWRTIDGLFCWTAIADATGTELLGARLVSGSPA